MPASQRNRQDAPALIVTPERTFFAEESVEEEDVEVLDSAKTENAIEELVRRCGQVATPILPVQTVFWGQRGQCEVLVLQEPPAVRTVPWTRYLFNRWKWNRGYRLAFPYVVIGMRGYHSEAEVHLDRIDIFYRNKPITSLEDTLYQTNLRNVIHSSICLGGIKSAPTMRDAAQLVWEALWNRAFNKGYRDNNYRRFARKTTGSVGRWAAKSKKNPSFVLDIKWPESRYTVAGLIKKCLLGNDGSETKQPARSSRTFHDLLDVFWKTEEDKTTGWAG